MQLQNAQVFISYKKKGGQTPTIAQQIADTLDKEYGYQVFLDTVHILTAAEWEKLIYANIQRSDVLIVLMDAETADSQWVQREVDVARGANVSILPLAIVDPKQIDILDAAGKLAIRNLQHSQYFQGAPNDFQKLVIDIERLKKITRDTQKKWIQDTRERWRVRPPMDHKAKYRTFPLDSLNFKCALHLAVGDIMRMGYFDVIVNTENDYMQMARVYEYTTLSSQLRYLGSLEHLGRIMEDSVQAELDTQITKLKTGRPVPLTQVIVTNAGHEDSILRRKARYIFHSASVHIAGAEAATTITPVNTDDGIRQLVYNVLYKVIDVNRNQGIGLSSRKKHKNGTAEPAYKPLENLIFPLFGTGQSGRSVLDVAPAMVMGIYDFLFQHGNDPLFTLTDIHIAVYSAAEIGTVEAEMEKVFGQASR